jgi:hypothetical protein
MRAMSSFSPDLRFGIEVAGQRSYTWRVRSAVKSPQLYVERENLAGVTHVSLHTSKRWHVKVRDRKVHQWIRPAEITPGYTRALVIMQPVAVATISLPAPADALILNILKVPADAEPTHFDLWIERSGANLQSWPGQRAMGTALVGRLPLADGAGTCCVVSRQAPIPPGSITLARPPQEEFARILDAASKGHFYVTVTADLEDGTVPQIDLRHAAASEA